MMTESQLTEANQPAAEEIAEVEQQVRGPLMLRATYAGVVAFICLFFFRPQDFFSALQFLPVAKTAGMLIGLFILVSIIAERVRLNREAKLLLVLFAWLCLAVAGSMWRGGSFDVVVKSFSKVVLVAIAVMCSVTTVPRLRRLLTLQTLAMLLMSGLALSHDTRSGRMFGVGSLFADPNDFALNLCIILPFCIAMLLSVRNGLMKMFWLGAAALALLAIVSTVSRGGFLALIAVTIAMWRYFRVKAQTAVFVLILVAGCGAIAVATVGSSSYFGRMSTITDVQADESGSAQIRKDLLIRSIELTLMHPLLGIGPGQFAQNSGSWHVTHNSYTQFSAEAGIPALLLFLLLIRNAFKNLKQVRCGISGTQEWYLAGALYCGMVGYLVGAFFLSTGYWFVPYLWFAYAAAIAEISRRSSEQTTLPPTTNDNDQEAFEVAGRDLC